VLYHLWEEQLTQVSTSFYLRQLISIRSGNVRREDDLRYFISQKSVNRSHTICQHFGSNCSNVIPSAEAPLVILECQEGKYALSPKKEIHLRIDVNLAAKFGIWPSKNGESAIPNIGFNRLGGPFH